MIPADLFQDPARRSHAAMPEMDALTEQGALQEAALVAARVDVLHSAVGLLFDLRGALQLRMGTVAVLIARKVERFEWSTNRRSDHAVWYAVMDSVPDTRSGRLLLRLAFAPHAELVVEAEAAEFYVGDMPGMDQAPPDFLEDSDEVIRAGMPSWESRFVPGFATFLDADSDRGEEAS